MPFLDVRNFITEAIESVRAQRYGAWELLLINDGSTDGTAALARGYAEREPKRIRLLGHPDGGRHGASASRNVGLAHARGEFIAFLDADDVWLPENLAEQVPRLQAVPGAGVLFSRTLYWYTWSGAAGVRDHTPRLRSEPGRVVPPPLHLARSIQGRAAVPCTCSILIRRSLIEEVGGFEDDFRQVYTDQVFYSKLFLTSGVLPVEGCWAKYRRHPASSTMTMAREQKARSARLAYLSWLDQYARAHGAPSSLMRAVQRELWRCRHPAADYLLDQLAFLRRWVERARVG